MTIYGVAIFRTCLSLITNRAAGTSPEPLSHEEVEEAGRTAAAALVDLLTAAIPEFTL